MFKRLVSGTALLVIFILISGCSGGGNPITPSGIQEFGFTHFSSLPVGVSEFSSDGTPEGGSGVLGVFEVHIDPVTMTAEMHSLRENTSTDFIEVVDITNFLQIAPCVDCAKIMGLDLSPTGNLIVDIGIKHPFPAGDPTKPVTGKNRADLHIFNIEGAVVAEAGSSISFGSIGDSVSNFKLVNADGYSAYLDGVLDTILATTATIHPYILHFDDYSAGNFSASNPTGFLSVTTPPPTGNLVMAMGADYDVQPYEFEFSSSEGIHFIYAVSCTYGLTAESKAMRFHPEYRVPQHLKKAASEVHVRITSNNLAGGNPSSSATIEIDVVDISQDVPVGTDLNQMKSSSLVGSVIVEIPGVIDNYDNVGLINIGGSGHDPTDPLTYAYSFTNELSAPSGIYPGLVKVVDTYPVGTNVSPHLHGYDGIQRTIPGVDPLTGLFAVPEFATYQIFEIEISDFTNILPVAVLLPETITIYEGGSVAFDGTGSYDTDGTVDLYEFDFDWDSVPANFTVDDSNVTGTVTSDPYATMGVYTAGLRVTDNIGGVDYDTCEVTVQEWTSSCPAAPFAGDPFTETLTYGGYYLAAYSSDLNWQIHSDIQYDVAYLSSGQVVAVHSQGISDYIWDGSLRLVSTTISNNYTIVDGDYPGYRAIQLDVDSTDTLVMVTSDLPHETEIWRLPSSRNTFAHTYFRVLDPFIGHTTEQQVTVGTKIAAVAIDENDDVWVLDINNVMHKYEKLNSYAENVAAGFDLDVTTGATFNNAVFDFAIDYYNEAFFICTENDDPTKVDVWRIECDGQYLPSVNGNPNPMTDVLYQSATHPLNSSADIAIDNRDSSDDILTGEQDSQIVIIGNHFTSTGHGGLGMVTRIDADLDQHVEYIATGGDGLSSICFNESGNVSWGWGGAAYADCWLMHYTTPTGWY